MEITAFCQKTNKTNTTAFHVLPPGLEPGTLALGLLLRFELILTNKILINSLDFITLFIIRG